MTDNAEYVSLAFQTRAGDMRAGEKLAIALHDPLFFFLRLRGIPNRDIEDLAQKTMIEVFRVCPATIANATFWSGSDPWRATSPRIIGAFDTFSTSQTLRWMFGAPPRWSPTPCPRRNVPAFTLCAEPIPHPGWRWK